MQQQGVRVILAQLGLKGSSSAQGPCPHYTQPRQRMGLAPRQCCLVEPTKNFSENMETPQLSSFLHSPDCQKSCTPDGKPGHTPDLHQEIRRYQTEGTIRIMGSLMTLYLGCKRDIS